MKPCPPIDCETTQPAQATVIGIGSCHGDDRLGWDVVERLATEFPHSAICYKASVPHDLLDWLEPASPTHIIDGCLTSHASCQRLEIVADEAGQLTATACHAGSRRAVKLPTLQSNSSHQFDVLATLRLAAVLGKLPQQLIVWAIPILDAGQLSGASAVGSDKAQECFHQLVKELSHA